MRKIVAKNLRTGAVRTYYPDDETLTFYQPSTPNTKNGRFVVDHPFSQRQWDKLSQWLRRGLGADFQIKRSGR